MITGTVVLSSIVIALAIGLLLSRPLPGAVGRYRCRRGRAHPAANPVCTVRLPRLQAVRGGDRCRCGAAQPVSAGGRGYCQETGQVSWPRSGPPGLTVGRCGRRCRCGKSGRRGCHRGGTVHRVQSLRAGLPRRCHRRCSTDDAYGHIGPLYRLYVVPAALPRGLYFADAPPCLNGVFSASSPGASASGRRKPCQQALPSSAGCCRSAWSSR